MDSSIDHHCFVLDLPNGSSKLSVKQVTRAYKLKALALHPDKRPNDPNAHINFQKLKTSYEFLKDHILLLSARRQQYSNTAAGDHDHINGGRGGIKQNRQQYSQYHDDDDNSDHSKKRRRKMVSDLEEIERAAATKEAKAREEERIHSQLKAEIAKIRASKAREEERIHSLLKAEIAKIRANLVAVPRKKPSMDGNYIINNAMGTAASTCTGGLDMERMLTVSWEISDRDYSVQRLKQVFEAFGKVEDVMISAKERDLAMVVMASKDAALAAARTVCGDLFNPLLVMPFTSSSVHRFSYLDGLRYQEYDDSVLTKLQNFAA